MSGLRRTIRFTWLVAGAALDALLFPFRIFFFFFRKNKYRKEIVSILNAPPAELANKVASNTLTAPKKIFVSVGDISAEPHAVRLIEEMKRKNPNVSWLGFGGKKMEQAGCRILFNPIELALIGFTGPAKQVPAHMGALKTFLKTLDEEKPDLVILVDYPGFNLVLAKAAKGKVPVIYYVCPQLWAWAPWRVSAFRKNVSEGMSIFPFETNFFRKKGTPTSFVGHPIADLFVESDQKISYQKTKQETRSDKRPILALLPGSRDQELRRNLPAMIRVAKELVKAHPEIRVVLPHERENLLPRIQEIASHAPFPIEIRIGQLHQTLSEAHLVFVKSGTAVMEVAHYEAPMVVFYKFADGFQGKISEFLRNHFLITPYFTSLNILEAREIVPEFAYGNPKREEEIVQKAKALWDEGLTRQECKAALRHVRTLYDIPGAATRTAELVLQRLSR